MGITSELCRDLAGIGGLSERDRARLRLLVVDFAAASCAGYALNREFNAALERVVFAQGGAEECHVFRQARRWPARTAAFMNSAYGHGAELDDGSKQAAGHPGVHVIPAVFALAEKLGSSGEEVLEALATGYEAYIRISAAAQPGMVRRGFHSTGMAGTLACAAACARLCKIGAAGLEDALALATTMSGGLLSYGDSRPAIKPLNPGKAAENGLFAALLAGAGMRGPAEALEGPNGWFHAVTDEIHPGFLKGADHLLLHDCYFKLYPSCRHTHCGIDAGVALHGRIAGRGIGSAVIRIYPNAIRLAGLRAPASPDETKFSIPYTLACALLKGSYGIADMDVGSAPAAVRDLAGKIEMVPDDSMEDRSRGIRGARVEVTLEGGQTVAETVTVPKGDPENPLSRGDIVRKLETCAQGLAGKGELDAFLEATDALGGPEQFENPMARL